MKSSLMLKLLLLDGDWIIESKYLLTSDQEFYLAEISHVGNCRKFRILLDIDTYFIGHTGKTK